MRCSTFSGILRASLYSLHVHTPPHAVSIADEALFMILSAIVYTVHALRRTKSRSKFTNLNLLNQTVICSIFTRDQSLVLEVQMEVTSSVVVMTKIGYIAVHALPDKGMHYLTRHSLPDKSMRYLIRACIT